MIPAAKGDGPLLRMELWGLDIITNFPPPKPFDGVTNMVAAEIAQPYASKTTFKEWVSLSQNLIETGTEIQINSNYNGSH